MKDFQKARRKRLTERLQALRQRAHLIEEELQEFTKHHFRVCIFGSARIKPEDDIYQMTYDLAYKLGEEGIDVLTGGGPGLMEAANMGVKAGVESSGSISKSFGISIELNSFEEPNDHLDIKHHHKRFSSRLDDFMRLSNAVIVTPGGIGTLLELYYTWQLLQVSHMTDRPIILINKKFWEGLIEWMKEVQVGNKLVSPGDFRWLEIVDTPDEAMAIVKKEYAKFIDVKTAQGEV